MHDVIVVGLGGAGSSAAYHVAKSGGKVLGLEQFGPVHSRGSSHGRSRIYRTAYFEGTAYVPLVQRAEKLWFQLQESTRERIVQKTGGLVLGRPDSATVSGAVGTARECGLEHSILTPEDLRSKYPQFGVDADEVALWDPAAGVLFPETCVRTYASGAVEAGGELHYGEAVRSWSAHDDGVAVRTRTGEYRARSLVLTVGAWTASMVSDLALPLEIERQFMLFFPPSSPELVGPDRLPVFVWDRGTEVQTYGVPDFGDGVKVGSWHGKVTPAPDTADRVLRESEAFPVRKFVQGRLRGVLPREREFISCLYTNAPDHNFLIGYHPRHPNVIVVSACSGHGFKFTSVLGEIIARLARHEPPGFNLTMFNPGRFLPNASG